MESLKQNKMGTISVPKLIWRMGLPMIVSMVLQAVYNIVDTAFVINMGEDGTAGNLALTYAFPIQLLIIAVGVGTGVGINALLSKCLGEGNRERASRIAGNGIFLAVCIYLVFLLFGLFGARPFIAMQANGNAVVTEMGTEYLQICCCFSFGAVGFTIYERFLQATGRTGFSTISQITGAVLNIVLDYVFIFPCGMGVAGAAWATVIGQTASLLAAMAFHYFANPEISGRIAYARPSARIIRDIYRIGVTAAVMQALLSVMMLGMNLILGTAQASAELLQGAFGIYYKIQQFALFAAFGISNTLISVVSFNYGMGNRERVRQGVKWGIIAPLIVAAVITVLFQALAQPLAAVFGMAGGNAQNVCVTALHVATLGYVFMGLRRGHSGHSSGVRLCLEAHDPLPSAPGRIRVSDRLPVHPVGERRVRPVVDVPDRRAADGSRGRDLPDFGQPPLCGLHARNGQQGVRRSARRGGSAFRSHGGRSSCGIARR